MEPLMPMNITPIDSANEHLSHKKNFEGLFEDQSSIHRAERANEIESEHRASKPSSPEKDFSLLPPARWQVIGLIVLLRFGAKYCVDALNLMQ